MAREFRPRAARILLAAVVELSATVLLVWAFESIVLHGAAPAQALYFGAGLLFLVVITLRETRTDQTIRIEGDRVSGHTPFRGVHTGNVSDIDVDRSRRRTLLELVSGVQRIRFLSGGSLRIYRRSFDPATLSDLLGALGVGESV